MPHLERQTLAGDWVELEGTKHNYDPRNKSKRARMAHGIMSDMEGQVREVPDSAGKNCFRQNLKKKRNVGGEWHLPFGPI